MKHFLFFLLIFLARALAAMQDDQESQALPIKSDRSDYHLPLKVSCSPGDWPHSESCLVARQTHAGIEHQESSSKSNGVHLATFMSNQSLTLIDSLKESLQTFSGNAQIDTKLQEMLNQIKEPACDTQENPFDDTTTNWDQTVYHTSDLLASKVRKNPVLEKGMDQVIVLQALFLNKAIRLLAEKK